MALTRGMALGPYEIVDAIAAGESGELYRARDARVGRLVALRTLRAPISDLESRDRFVRDAERLARISHPNVAQLYEVRSEGDVDFLVMEHVSGETLADRIGIEPMPIPEALVVAAQICEAIGHVHGAGLVHGALTPAGIVLRPSVVLADLPLGGGAPHSQYTAPEVIEGRDADARSDIWAFGCILYEMLAGRRAFVGTSSLLAASIRNDDPPAITVRQPDVPPALEAIVHSCLAKNPDDRPPHAGDLLDRLGAVDSTPAPGIVSTASEGRNRGTRNGWIAVAAGVACVAAAFAAWRLLSPVSSPPRQAPLQPAAVAPPVTVPPASTETPPPTTALVPPSAPATLDNVDKVDEVAKVERVEKVVYLLPEGQQFTRPGRRVLAVSPDGTSLAYVANQQIYVRRGDEEAGQPLADTNEDPSSLFYSPDGRWLAYFTPPVQPAGEWILKKLPLSGGKPVKVGQFPSPLFGATWGNGVIVVGSGSSVMSVADKGGTPTVRVSLGLDELVALPQFVGSEQEILLTVLGRGPSGAVDWNTARIVLLDVRTGQRRVIVEGGHSAVLLPGGLLSYVRDRTLLVAPLDLGSGRVGRGESTIAGIAGIGPSQFAVSQSGRLVYAPVAASGERASIVSIDGWLASVQPRPPASPPR
jgi:hypothetical protein